MAIEYLSGVDYQDETFDQDGLFEFEYDNKQQFDDPAGELGRRRLFRRRKKRKKIFGKGGVVRKFIKKAGKLIVKVSASPVRGAFLGILKLNGLGFATKLRNAIKSDPNKVKKFWEKAGGKYSQLIRTVNQGAKRRRLGNADLNTPCPQVNDFGYETLGAAGTLASAIAVATPLIIASTKLIKSIKPQETVHTPEEEQTISDATGTYKEQLQDEVTGTVPSNFSSGGQQGFFEKYKKQLLIAGAGIIGAGGLYALLKKR